MNDYRSLKYTFFNPSLLIAIECEIDEAKYQGKNCCSLLSMEDNGIRARESHKFIRFSEKTFTNLKLYFKSLGYDLNDNCILSWK